MRRLRASISPHDSAKRFTELGIDVYFGQGTFKSSNTVVVGDQTVHFKKAVIATGARAAELPIPGLMDVGYLNNETLFSLTELPKRLIVIGGGPIGCEMAQSFARFGSQITLIELSSHILSREDEDAALIVKNAMQKEGVEMVLGAKVIRVESEGSGRDVVLSRNGEMCCLNMRTARFALSPARIPSVPISWPTDLLRVILASKSTATKNAAFCFRFGVIFRRTTRKTFPLINASSH